MKLYGRPIDARKLAAVVALLCVILIALFLVLPMGLVRLLVMGGLALPVLLILFDRPKILFYIFVFLIFSNVDAYAPMPVFQPFTIFLIAAFAVEVIRGRKLSLFNPGFAALVAAYFLLAFQSAAWARDVDTAVKMLDKLVQTAVYLLLTSQFVNDRREFRFLIAVMAAGVVTSNLLPFFGFLPANYAGPALIGSQGVFRFQGLALEPNAVAFWQIFFIPLYLYLIKAYRRRAGIPPLAVACLLLSVLVIVLSFSRGAFVSFAVLFLLILYLERRNRVFLATGIALVVVAILLIPQSYVIRVSSIIRALSDPARDQPSYTRLVTMGVALKLSARYFFTGVGIGNFMHYAVHYTSYPLVVHNALLLTLSELGIFALGVMVAIIGYNVRILRRLMRGEGEVALLGRMLLLQHAAVLVNSMFLPSSYDHIFWYTLALPAFAAHAYRSPSAAGAGRPGDGAPSGGSPGPAACR